MHVFDKQMLCWTEYVTLLVKSGLFNLPLYEGGPGACVAVGYAVGCT